MRKHVLIVWVLVVLAVVSAGIATAASEDAQRSTLTVGFIPIADCLQLYVGEQMGFFEEEGLKINRRSMQSGTVIAPAVEAGDVDIGWSNTVSIIRARSKGFDHVFFVSGAFEADPDHRTHALLVATDSTIQKFADLAGKTVAINVLGNVNELSLSVLAEANGMNVQDIRLVELPFPDMEPALKNRSVDAALVTEPFVSLAIAHGNCRYLVKSVHRSFGERFMIASWFAKRSWIEKNRAQAEAFARAVQKASRYIMEHPQDMPGILTRNTKLTLELAQKMVLPGFSDTLDPDEIQRMITTAAKHKLIKSSFDADQIVCPLGVDSPGANRRK